MGCEAIELEKICPDCKNRINDFDRYKNIDLKAIREKCDTSPTLWGKTKRSEPQGNTDTKQAKQGQSSGQGQQQNNIPWDNSTGYGVSGYEKNKGWVSQGMARQRRMYGYD